MKYFVHVLTHSSLHEKKENDFLLVPSENGEVLLSDIFYQVEGKDHFDVVIKLLSIIKIEGYDKTLSQAIIETKNKLSVSDFSNNHPDRLLTDYDKKQIGNTYGQYFSVTCHLDKKDDNGTWIEVHRVELFVVEEEKIVEIV